MPLSDQKRIVRTCSPVRWASYPIVYRPVTSFIA
ncbi:hypothetical protein HNP84_006814 [Thermocatellispora tengchongensis]|uniref:Uncharacterized protein n=1 Tax=Thermocatellispora tengchongensis TaxID=1073253 RepID=A0A840PCU7_9ACTN|nr:hypothetical protein [Thermocatellispora tengchongensis]